MVQTLTGRRAVGQLERWLSEPVLAEVAYLARTRARTGNPGAGPGLTATVVSVRVQLPRPTVAEVAVHLRVGPRSQAMALRLEALGDRWLCTALERGPAPPAAGGDPG